MTTDADKPIRPRALTVVLPAELYVWLETLQAELREKTGIRISLSEVVRSQLNTLKDAGEQDGSAASPKKERKP